MRNAKEALWSLWQRVLDLTLGLDRIADGHARWPWRLSREARAGGLVLFAAPYLTEHRFALDFIALPSAGPFWTPS